MTHRDFFCDNANRVVRPGDYVVYPYSYADRLGLRYGKVLEIRFAPTNEWSDKKSLGIHVRAIDDFCGKPRLCKTKAVLRFPDRVLLANDFISEAYKRLLDAS